MAEWYEGDAPSHRSDALTPGITLIIGSPWPTRAHAATLLRVVPGTTFTLSLCCGRAGRALLRNLESDRDRLQVEYMAIIDVARGVAPPSWIGAGYRVASRIIRAR